MSKTASVICLMELYYSQTSDWTWMKSDAKIKYVYHRLDAVLLDIFSDIWRPHHCSLPFLVFL